MTYSDVTWDSSTAINTTISGGQVTATAISWASNVKGTDAITSSDSVKFTINTNYAVGGIGKDPFTATPHQFSAIEFGWHWSSGWKTYEDGSETGDYGGSVSDEARVTRNGSNVEWYLNDVLKRTETGVTNTSVDYYPQASMSGINSSISMETNASSDPDQTIEIGYDGTPTDPDQTIEIGYDDGSIGWKWWIGMRGKRRYGNKAIQRLRI